MRILLTLFLALRVLSNDILIQSKIYPNILQYDRDFKEKLIDDKILFLIIYDKTDKLLADELKRAILEQNDLKIDVKLLDKDSKEIPKATAFYIFNIDDENLKRFLDFATQHSIITFANSNDFLPKGVAVGISNDRRISPILNKEVLKRANIKFTPTLLKVSKIYE